MSVHKRSRNGKTTYMVSYRHGNKQPTESYSRKVDADKRDAEIKLAKERGEPIPRRGRGDAKETFEDFAYESWWPAEVVGKKLTPKTQERYATFLDKHLIPRIGDEALTYIDVQKVLEVRTGLVKDNVPDYTAARTLKLLRQVLHFAVLSGKLPVNPADVFARRGMLPKQTRKHDLRPIWPDETETIRAAILASQSPNALRDATMVSVIAYAGLRPDDELFRLTWAADQKDKLRVYSYKNKRWRTIPIIKPLQDDIAMWRKASASTAAKALMFPGEDGALSTAARGNWRNRVFHPHAPEGTTPYSLRHGYSLLLAREGVDDRDAAARMDHSTAMHHAHYDGFLESLRGKARKPMATVVKQARAKAAVPPKAKAA